MCPTKVTIHYEQIEKIYDNHMATYEKCTKCDQLKYNMKKCAQLVSTITVTLR